MIYQSTSQDRLHCFTAKVSMVVQLFMSLPLALYTLQRCLNLTTVKTLTDTTYFAKLAMCLPSIYLYNKQQTKLPSFICL